MQYRYKNWYYIDNSKVREDLRIDCRKEAKEFVVDFDIQTRILTVSDFLKGDCQKIFVVKVLEDVDLSKVHLCFEHYVVECNEKQSMVEIDANNFQSVDVEFETHDQTLVGNRYNSIVKAKLDGIHCWLLDTPLMPFKKYKFQLWRSVNKSTQIHGLGNIPERQDHFESLPSRLEQWIQRELRNDRN